MFTLRLFPDPPTLSPAITANPELPDTQPVYQGDNMTLRCTVSGGKPVNATVIMFTCPGKTDTSVVSMDTSSITSSLMFLPVSSDNHGRCVCTARWKKTDWYNQTVSWNINVYSKLWFLCVVFTCVCVSLICGFIYKMMQER